MGGGRGVYLEIVSAGISYNLFWIETQKETLSFFTKFSRFL